MYETSEQGIKIDLWMKCGEASRWANDWATSLSKSIRSDSSDLDVLPSTAALIHMTKIVRDMGLLIDSLIALHQTMHPFIFRVNTQCVLEMGIDVDEIQSLSCNSEASIVKHKDGSVSALHWGSGPRKTQAWFLGESLKSLRSNLKLCRKPKHPRGEILSRSGSGLIDGDAVIRRASLSDNT